MNTLRNVLFFLVVIYVFACSGEYTCTNEWLRPGLRGYPSHEADSLIVKRFQKGTGFSVFVDSAVLHNPQPVFGATDTTFYFYNDFIDGAHDVQLINHFDYKTVAISDMKYDIREGKKTMGCSRQEACTSPLISYNRDGIPVTAAGSPQLVQVVLRK